MYQLPSEFLFHSVNFFVTVLYIYQGPILPNQSQEQNLTIITLPEPQIPNLLQDSLESLKQPGVYQLQSEPGIT